MYILPTLNLQWADACHDADMRHIDRVGDSPTMLGMDMLLDTHIIHSVASPDLHPHDYEVYLATLNL